MFYSDNQIAVFKESVYKDGFGFYVSVFVEDNNEIYVESSGELNDYYDNFEEFMEDLILKNPLWYTYNQVKARKEYQEIITVKLRESIINAMDLLTRSIECSRSNWQFEKSKIGDVVEDCITEYIHVDSTWEFINTANNIEDENSINEELDTIWNGFCPESWLQGKLVKMRLNKNDFFESEVTGLQMAVFSGVQAIVLNFRGKGNFRNVIQYAIANGEYLSPQNSDFPPFNSPAEIFENVEAITDYIKNIK